MSCVSKRATIVAVALALAARTMAGAGAQDIPAKLDEYMAAAVKLGRFSGSVLVARDGKVLLSKGYGMANLELDVPNTPQTKFRIASVTKPFTATAIMLLQERGALNVQDKLCKHVADCPPAWSAITIHHLLTHTSGVPNYTGFPDYVATMREAATVESLIGRFKNKPLDFAPGGEYRYSNSGYALLGHIIERVSGIPYAQFIQRNIFTPLRMADSGFDGPFRILKNRAAGYSRSGETVINAPFIAMTIVYSAGGLFSTVEDLYLWDQALAANALLSPASMATMLTPVANDYGYGWGTGRQLNRRHVGHNGQVNGFTSVLARYPDDRAVVIILTNSDQTTPPVDRVARDLAAIMFGEPYELPKPRTVVAVEPRILDSYVGEYELKAKVFATVTRTGNQISVQITGGPPLALAATSETEFEAEVVEARVIFVKDAQGVVTHLILRQGSDQQAKKIK